MTTTIEQTLQELERFDAGGHAVLSLYLLTDPSVAAGRKLHAQLEDLSHQLRGDGYHSSEWHERLDRKFTMAATAIDRLETPPRSLAVFVCAEQAFVRTVALPVRLAPNAFLGPAPYLRPLHAVLDEYERTLVVLIDKERARLFQVYLDQISTIDELTEPAQGHHRQTGGAWAYPPSPDWTRGGWGDSGIVRHEEMHRQHHARQTADALRRHSDKRHIDRVVIAGTPEMVAELRQRLPRSLAGRVAVAAFHIPMFASPPQILEGARATLAEMERAKEQALLDELGERFGSGMAVSGSLAVTEAAYQRNILLLFIGQSGAAPGGRCPTCARLLPPPVPDACPVCGNPVRPVLDLAAHLAESVIDAGGRVESLQGQAEQRLAALGGFAAFLRHVPAELVSRA